MNAPAKVDLGDAIYVEGDGSGVTLITGGARIVLGPKVAMALGEYLAALRRGLELMAQLPPDELAMIQRGEVSDVDGAAWLKWLETGEGVEPTGPIRRRGTGEE